MLYTLSLSRYDLAELNEILEHLGEDDVLVLWQDGVLQAVKYPELFARGYHCFVLKQDLNARGLSTTLPTIDMNELVRLSEQYTPHIGL